VRRALVAAAAFSLVALAGPGRAAATNECKGLDVCISVPGPWVAIPAAPATGVSTVSYQVTCPKRSVAGGLDAVLGDLTLEVRFLGKLGSPVNPGISTAQRDLRRDVGARAPDGVSPRGRVHPDERRRRPCDDGVHGREAEAAPAPLPHGLDPQDGPGRRDHAVPRQ
jgi:hypothetical protein